MIRILQLKLPVDHTPDALEKKICQQLKIKKEELSSWKIVRRSLDARKKPDLKFVYVVDVDTPKERKILHRMQKVNDKNIMLFAKSKFSAFFFFIRVYFLLCNKYFVALLILVKQTC